MQTPQRIAAVRERLRLLQIDERRAEMAGRSCRECIFGPIDALAQDRCDHIIHWTRRFDPATGKWRGSNEVSTAEARDEEGLCGPEGMLFEPYSFKGRVARTLGKVSLVGLFVGAMAIAGICFDLFL